MADLNIIVNESVTATETIAELFGDSSVSQYDSVVVNERFLIYKQDDFSDFVRSLPFVDYDETNIDSIMYENGVEQIADRWGKTRKKFDIKFPVSQKAEAVAIQTFFKNNIGRTFLFTSPIDGVTYNVQFEGRNYRLERRHYSTYFASVTLVEVF